MSTIYFTNTAHTGDGTLRQALLDARDGDVVEPDPSVFGAGETVSIAVSSPLEVAVGATLRAGATRLTLLRTTQTAATIFSATANATGFVAEDVAFVGRVYVYSADATFRRCRFNGNAANAHLLQVQTGGGLTLDDCAVYGGLGRGVSVASRNDCAATIVRSTIAGNASACLLPDSATIADSIVDPVCSEAGFFSPPPDAIPTDQGALPWSNWNLRLRPTSQYASGATTGSGEYDCDGNPRGRAVPAEGNNASDSTGSENTDASGSSQSGSSAGALATVYAVGAFEVVDADYLAKYANVSFDDPSDWATYAGTPSQLDAGVYYFSGANVATGSPPAGSSLFVGGRGTLTLTRDVAVSALRTGLGTKIVLSGSDRVLRVASASIAQTTVASATRGYFAAPSGTVLTGATFENVVACEVGAGASRFRATASGVSWSSEDSTVSVLLEKRSASVWTTVAQTTGESYSVALDVGDAVRVFDGEKFLTASLQKLHAWLEYSNTITVATATAKAYDVVAASVPRYNIAKGYVMASQYYNRGEAPVFFARIEDSATGAIVPKSAVSAISYTAYKVSTAWSSETRTPVEGHEDVEVSLDAYLDQLIDDDPRWTEDETGYNFIFEPDTTEAPIFPDDGRYVVVVTIQFANANPAPISYEVEVA